MQISSLEDADTKSEIGTSHARFLSTAGGEALFSLPVHWGEDENKKGQSTRRRDVGKRKLRCIDSPQDVNSRDTLDGIRNSRAISGFFGLTNRSIIDQQPWK